MARRVFHQALHDVTLDQFLAAVNHVEPSLIRVQADEVTYNLHIIVRFEMEQALLAGDLPTADLPEAWNQKYRETLGVSPANDAEGCLQDIHWAPGFSAISQPTRWATFTPLNSSPGPAETCPAWMARSRGASSASSCLGCGTTSIATASVTGPASSSSMRPVGTQTLPPDRVSEAEIPRALRALRPARNSADAQDYPGRQPPRQHGELLI